jgi:hypothetical protein
MRRRRRNHSPRTDREQRELEQAQAAVAEELRALEASHRKTPQVKSYGHKLRRMREENNFSLRVQEMLEGRYSGAVDETPDGPG